MTILPLMLLTLGWLGPGETSLQYLGQKRPTLTPEIFAPTLISKSDQYEYGSVFSQNGLQFFFGVALGNRAEIRFTQAENGEWTEPKPLVHHETYSFNDPFLSPDEKRLYFISDFPTNGTGPKKDYDIWYVEKLAKGWSKPISAGPAINSESNEYYMSFTQDGSMYFSSNVAASREQSDNFDIYVSAWRKGAFQTPIQLGDAINSADYEADVFVAPDATYMIFCATRPEGLGRGDLYISFKNKDGAWTPAKNMGPKINSTSHELCPFVSRDGRYFFYTSKKDIYWVDANLLESYR